MKTWARMLLLALALSSCEPYPPGYYNGYPGSGYSGPPSYYGSGYYSSPIQNPTAIQVREDTTTLPHHRTTPNLMVIRGQVGNID
jgi:hypothetical protein